MRVRVRWRKRHDWIEAGLPIVEGYKEIARAVVAQGHELVAKDDMKKVDLHIELDGHREPKELDTPADRVVFWCHHGHDLHVYKAWIERHGAIVYFTDRAAVYTLHGSYWLPNAAPSSFLKVKTRKFEHHVAFFCGQPGRASPLSWAAKRVGCDVVIGAGRVVPIDVMMAEMAASRYMFNRTGHYGTLGTRIAEAMALGKLCITDEPGAGTHEVFERGTDYVPWETPVHLQGILAGLKAAPDKDLRKISKNLRKRALQHTYTQRAESILAHLEGRLEVFHGNPVVLWPTPEAVY